MNTRTLRKTSIALFVPLLASVVAVAVVTRRVPMSSGNAISSSPRIKPFSGQPVQAAMTIVHRSESQEVAMMRIVSKNECRGERLSAGIVATQETFMNQADPSHSEQNLQARQEWFLNLGVSEDPKDLDVLLQCFTDPGSSTEDQITAAIALAQERDPALLEMLLPLGLSEEEPLRSVRVGEIRDERGLAALLEGFQAPQRSLEQRCILAKVLGPSLCLDSVATAMKEVYLAESDPKLRTAVITEMGRLRDEASQEFIRRAILETFEPETQIAGVMGLHATSGENRDLLNQLYARSVDPQLRSAILLKSGIETSFLVDVIQGEPDATLREHATLALELSE
jgi:hypothetical protein